MMRSIYHRRPSFLFVQYSEMVVLLLFLLTLTTCIGGSSSSTSYDEDWQPHHIGSCVMEEMPIVLLRKDQATGQISVVKRYKAGESIPSWKEQKKLLVNHHTMTKNENVTMTDPSEGNHDDEYESSEISSNILDGYDVFYMRECTCDHVSQDQNFCPMTVTGCVEIQLTILDPTIDTNPISQTRRRSIVSCENPVNQRLQRKNKVSIYISIVSSIVGMILLFLTHQGRSALSYLPNRLSSGRWNEKVVYQLLRNQREWAYRLGRRHVERRMESVQNGNNDDSLVGQNHNGAGNGNNNDGRRSSHLDEDMSIWVCYRKQRTQRLTSLILSTTTYRKDATSTVKPRTPSSLTSEWHHHHEVENDEEEEVECSICLCPIENGDKVGKLPCNHLMHVDCLKSWLQRQNACPLCKRLHIAQSRYEPINFRNRQNHRGAGGGGDELSNTRRTEGSTINQDLIHETTVDDEGEVLMDPLDDDIEALSRFATNMISIDDDDDNNIDDDADGLIDDISPSNGGGTTAVSNEDDTHTIDEERSQQIRGSPEDDLDEENLSSLSSPGIIP